MFKQTQSDDNYSISFILNTKYTAKSFHKSISLDLCSILLGDDFIFNALIDPYSIY
jgi:hypothetical protein